MPPKKAAAGRIEIKGTSRKIIRIPVVGVTPLICHAQSAKAARQMFTKQRGAKAVKQPKNPTSDFVGSLYLRNLADTVDVYDPDGEIITDYDGELTEMMPFWAATPEHGFGFPSAAFMNATVRAAKLRGVVMTDLRCALSARTQMLRIEGDDPQCRFDWVRVSQTTDLRFRAQFHEWRAVLEFSFAPSFIDAKSVAALVSDAGLGVGVGEWRPEKRGSFGQFQIDADRKIEVADLI